MDDQGQLSTRHTLAEHVEGLGAVDAQRLAVHAFLELQRQHAHADQVGAVDALEAFGRDRFHTSQAHALGGPVTRAALAVVGAGDDDQRLFAVHVGFDRFPHAGDLAFRLHARQRPLLDLAIDHGHFVDQLRVGERRTLRGEMVATVGRIGIEVFLGQAHLGQVLTGRAAGHDRVGRRQVIGGDVVAQHRQRAHAGEAAGPGQRAFPVRRAADVGALGAPVVQRADRCTVFHLEGEHRVVDLAELLRLDAGLDHRVDLGIARPQVLQRDRVAIGIVAERILFDIEAHRAGDRVRHHQRRRGQERLLGVRVDAAVEVAVARKHGGGIQVAVDHFLLDLRVQRAAHAVAGGAGEGHDAKAHLLQFGQQAGFFQIQLHGLGAGRQRAFHPRLAGQPGAVGIAGQQGGGDDVARVAGVGATGDRGDDHGAIGHQAIGLFLLARGELAFVGDAAGGQVGGRHTLVRVRRAGHVAHHGGQVELQHALVLRGDQIIGPQASGLGVGFHECDLVVLAAGQAQVIQGLLLDVEHRRGGAELRRHVGNSGAVADGQRVGALAVELDPRTDHALLAQELGQRQHHVGAGDARLRATGEFHADDVGQAHPRGTAEHHALRFQAAHADRDHAQRVHVRGVAVGAHAGIGEGHPVAHLHDRRHFLQIDLMHDPVARRNHVDVLERLLGPVDEVEPVFIAAVFDGAVLLERGLVEAREFHRQRVIHDQLGRHHRVDLRRVTAGIGDGIAQAGQIDQGGLAENVMAHHARREPREIQVLAALDQLAQRGLQRGRVAAAHQVFGQHARGIRQRGIGTGLDRIDRGTGIEIVQRGAGEVLAVLSIHGWR